MVEIESHHASHLTCPDGFSIVNSNSAHQIYEYSAHAHSSMSLCIVGHHKKYNDLFPSLGLENHWDAMNQTTISLEYNNRVVKWKDLAGPHDVFNLQRSGDITPSFEENGINGKPAIKFLGIQGGANSYLVSKEKHPTYGTLPFTKLL